LSWFRDFVFSWQLDIVAVAALLGGATPTLEAIKLQLTTDDIDRALVIAREPERARARFHAAYITNLNTPLVQSIEIVSEFRRVVLLAEEQILRGNRAFAYSTRSAADAVQAWNGRVSVVARLRFHPMNTYVTLPAIEMTVDGANADEAFIGVVKEPLFARASGARGEQVPIIGAVAEAVFDSALIGQTERIITLTLDGKELLRRQVNFASID
jgi:hypothetical protein